MGLACAAMTTHPMTWALVVEAVMNGQVYSCFSTDEEEVRKYEAKCDLYNDRRGSCKWMTHVKFGCRNTQTDRDFLWIKDEIPKYTHKYYVWARISVSTALFSFSFCKGHPVREWGYDKTPRSTFA